MAEVIIQAGSRALSFDLADDAAVGTYQGAFRPGAAMMPLARRAMHGTETGA